jgi:hypothetical protein
MTPGPWTVGRLMGGFCVLDADRAILAEMRGSAKPHSEHRENATACAALPELVDVLRAAESYFGDLPSRDREALRLHGRITRVLDRIGVDLGDG